MIREYKIKRSGKAKAKPLLYNISENGCWENISHAKDKDGYGKIQVDGKCWRIHRLVYCQENNVELAPDIFIRHKCDNPCCFNPEHLEIGSVQDNTDDRVNRGRSAKGESHGRTRLTDEQVIEIYFAAGSQTSIAERYGISQRMVSLIKRKEVRIELLKDL